MCLHFKTVSRQPTSNQLNSQGKSLLNIFPPLQTQQLFFSGPICWMETWVPKCREMN